MASVEWALRVYTHVGTGEDIAVDWLKEGVYTGENIYLVGLSFRGGLPTGSKNKAQ